MAICFISPLDSIARRSFRVLAAARSAATLCMAGFPRRPPSSRLHALLWCADAPRYVNLKQFVSPHPKR
ncbi:hypothetical protein BURMUCF1_2245 [Burkholderia multivorans ATCC BAA-247]|jgi:hypothetical protein|nr:hypothetical protein BURMUCF1_2245 [Burkholderia multivorans ATCC BAA-247]